MPGCAFVIACVLVRAPAGIVLMNGPGPVTVTLTVIVHVPPAGIAPPVRVKLTADGAAATEPPQLLVAEGLALFTMPAG